MLFSKLYNAALHLLVLVLGQNSLLVASHCVWQLVIMGSLLKATR